MLSAEEYLQRAQSLPSPEREFTQLEAVKLLIQARQIVQAQTVLSTIQNNANFPEIQDYRYLIQARLDLLEGLPEQALSTLNLIDANRIMASGLQADLLEIRADAQSQLGYELVSIRDRITLASMLSNDELASNQNQSAIWQNLMRLSPQQLRNEGNSANPIYNGWVNLAYLAKIYEYEPDELQAAIQQWSREYPYHPAQDMLGTPLPRQDIARNITAISPNQITLLLPLSGSLATSSAAIRDGFFTAFYADDRRDSNITINVIDTDEDQNIISAYQTAVTNGSDVIIGPLTKDGVETLQNLTQNQAGSHPPILALNYMDDESRTTSPAFYQLGLAPEDEAVQAGERAWFDGYLNAAVISVDSNWGERVSEAFISRWQALGGNVVTTTQYASSSDLQRQIRDLLNLHQSEQRARTLIRILDQPIEYEPRRRQDIDVIFLASSPVEARQIRPLLTFYYAQDIPIYATSSIYEGTPNPGLDEDMQSTIFCDAPWVIDNNNSQSQLQQNINMLWPNTAQRYTRLYALGVDAYQLIPQLNRLQAYPELAITGATGRFTLNSRQHIVRHLPCAQFVDGTPQLLAPMTL